jgi:phage terminase Nu1 subunit (DNA packaging protein)
MKPKSPSAKPRKTTKKSTKKDVLTFTTLQIADLFGITDRRVQQLADEKILKRTARGRYDVFESVKGYISYLQNMSLGKRSKEVNDIQKERARLYKAQADKTEIEIDVLENSLIPAEMVERVWARMIGAFRARCLSMASRLAPELITVNDYAECEALIRDTVHEALEELSDYDQHDYGDRPNRRKGRPPKRATAESDA